MKTNILNLASFLTIFRIILCFISTILILQQNIYYFFLAIIIISFSELTDIVDGYIARKHDLITNLGKILDPYADSISRIFIFFSFAYIGAFNILYLLIFIFRDITVSYIRLYSFIENNKANVSARFSGKLKGLSQSVFLYFLVLYESKQFFFDFELHTEKSVIYLFIILIGTLLKIGFLILFKIEGRTLLFSILGYVIILFAFLNVTLQFVEITYYTIQITLIFVAFITLYSIFDYIKPLVRK